MSAVWQVRINRAEEGAFMAGVTQQGNPL